MDYAYGTPSVALVAPVATRNSYFETTPELDSSSTSSPHIDEVMRFGSAGVNELYSDQQDWSGAGLITFSNFGEGETADNPPNGAESAESETADGEIPLTKLKRRAQNRASQRAFRERKEKHVKGLEYQLEALNEKHQDLLQSYTRQADVLVRLTGRIAELQAELRALESCAVHPYPSPSPAPGTLNHYMGAPRGNMMYLENFEKFDAFDYNSTNVQRDLALYPDDAMSCNDQNIDRGGPTPTTATGLPGFEDLLRL